MLTENQFLELLKKKVDEWPSTEAFCDDVNTPIYDEGELLAILDGFIDVPPVVRMWMGYEQVIMYREETE